MSMRPAVVEEASPDEVPWLVPRPGALHSVEDVLSLVVVGRPDLSTGRQQPGTAEEGGGGLVPRLAVAQHLGRVAVVVVVRPPRQHALPEPLSSTPVWGDSQTWIASKL